MLSGQQELHLLHPLRAVRTPAEGEAVQRYWRKQFPAFTLRIFAALHQVWGKKKPKQDKTMNQVPCLMRTTCTVKKWKINEKKAALYVTHTSVKIHQKTYDVGFRVHFIWWTKYEFQKIKLYKVWKKCKNIKNKQHVIFGCLCRTSLWTCSVAERLIWNIAVVGLWCQLTHTRWYLVVERKKKRITCCSHQIHCGENSGIGRSPISTWRFFFRGGLLIKEGKRLITLSISREHWPEGRKQSCPIHQHQRPWWHHLICDDLAESEITSIFKTNCLFFHPSGPFGAHVCMRLWANAF